MKRPLLWGILVLGLSIILVYYRAPLWGILFFGFFLGVLPLFVQSIKKTQTAFVLGLFCLGIYLSMAAFPVNDPLENFYGNDVGIKGVVSGSPVIESYGVVFNLTAQEVANEPEMIKGPVGLRITLPVQEDETPSLPIPGDLIIINGELSKPQGLRNPGGYDYQLYLKSKGIQGLVYVESGKIETVGRDPSIFDGIIGNKTQLETISAAYLSKDVSDLLNGVVFGEKDIDSEIKLNFQNAGVTHVLSVSGLHVGYVFLLISFLLTLLKVKKKTLAVLFNSGIVFLCGYDRL